MNRGQFIGRGRGQNPMQALPGNDADCVELPRNYGDASANPLLAWTGRPGAASNSSGLSSGIMGLTKMYIPRSTPITRLTLYVGTAGNTLTTGQNFVGLYTNAGVLIGTSADQTTAWGTTGVKTAALTGGPFVANSSNVEDYWVWTAVLGNGTTPPAFFNETNAAAFLNLGLSAAQSRSCFSGSAQTALPGSFTPSAVTPYSHAFFIAAS